MNRPIEKPGPDEYASFYRNYVESLEDQDPLDLLGRQIGTLRGLTETLDEDEEKARYAAGKWSVREVIGHLCDAERVFGYRALRFSRGDQSELQGFEENLYVSEGGADEVPLADLVGELEAMRYANSRLFQRLSPEQWMRSGVASNTHVTVRALAWIIAGHFEHHLGVLRDRYGLTEPKTPEA